jgi:hypothetical protein
VDPSPPPGFAASGAGAVRADDAACALPLAQFAAHRRELTGSLLDYPTNLVLIDRAGRLWWNGVAVEMQRLREYARQQARIAPPPALVIEPDRDAPCAVVREALAAALGAGRCSPQRCAFEWPGTMAPPPLPEAS